MARILLFDLETSPLTVHTWGLRDLNVGLSQIREHPRVIAMGAKWYGDSKTMFYSEYHHGREEMLAKAFALMGEADITIGYNSNGFDHPWLLSEFAKEGLGFPSPSKSIDLYRAAKKLRFPSHKLQYVAVALGLGGKVSHSGHQLWVDCLEGDEETKHKAWSKMRTYCKRDVDLLGPLYEKLRPLIANHPNLALYEDAVLDENGKPAGIFKCPHCASDQLQRRGFAVKQTRRYQRYQCQGCGTWTQDLRSDLTLKIEQGGVAR